MPLGAIKSMDYHFKAWRKQENIIKSLDKIFHEQDRCLEGAQNDKRL